MSIAPEIPETSPAPEQDRDLQALTRQKWRSFFDALAVQRSQTDQELALRREKLIAAACGYLASQERAQEKLPRPKAKKRSVSSGLVRSRGIMRNTWGCSDAWLKELSGLVEVFGKVPTKYELVHYLDFPGRQPVAHIRPNRKKANAA